MALAFRFNGWLTLASLIALCVAAPILVLGWHAFDSIAHWGHLLQYVLPNAFKNTVWLLSGVGVLVAAIGVGAAWFVTAYQFPTRSILSWALLLPLAVPTYIVAFAYLDVLHPLGPVQGLIRDALGYTSPRQFRLPDLRSLGGGILLLGFVLYPYVYLSARAMFATQAASLLEAARILGENGRSVFFRVALPLARPAVAVGLSLALLETLNDIGASEFLGIQTLTVSIYSTWVTRSDLAGAAQIALSMLVIVAGLIYIERLGRRHQRYSSNQRSRPVQPQRLTGWRAAAVVTLGWMPVVLGFVVPASYLINESVKYWHLTGSVSQQLFQSAVNTFSLALVATLVTIVTGIVVAWAARRTSLRSQDTRYTRVVVGVASMGYAVPGTVLGIGLLSSFVFVDGFLNRITHLWGAPDRLILMGSAAALVIAYSMRFLAIATGGVQAGLSRIPPSLEQASRLLGESPSRTLWRVHLPLLRPAVAASALLVFVDAMKELPATLLLRPMNFDTLATWLYAEAARGTYEEGSIAALIIVLVGLVPVIFLARTQLKSHY